MNVLLVSCYEMGHQPLNVAVPTSALRAAGHDVRCLDLALETWDPSSAAWADAVAFSVPMHTAMRLAVRGAEAVRRDAPGSPVCFYGLYATASLEPVADRLIAGEYLDELVAWVDGTATKGPVVSLRRGPAPVPDRTTLPTLDRYARLEIGGEERTAGYTEATHGCAHRCRHCPVPAVYDGRTRRVPVETVLADVKAQVAMGARHVTFGDPDFFNRTQHAMAVLDAVHASFPGLTYDVTVKVEHLLRHADLLPRLADTGCLFVVSAFEILNDRILGLLDKGHSAAEAGRAVHLLREVGIEIRPSWLPFTPWTTVPDVSDILRFVVDHDLISNVDPVQYSIRLLVPEGSLLLGVDEMRPHLGPYDPDSLSYTWTPADPRTDELQRRITTIVSEGAEAGRSSGDQLFDIWESVHGESAPQIRAGSTEGRPRLTEPWFC